MDYTQDIKTFTETVLEKLAITADVTVEPTEDNIRVTLNGDNLGMVIGHHGTTLHSLEHLITLAASQKAGELVHIHLEAGDWRKNREQQLQEMAQRAIDRVINTGQEYEMPPMNPQERRIVHMAISEAEGVVSESAGEGGARHIVVKPAH